MLFQIVLFNFPWSTSPLRRSDTLVVQGCQGRNLGGNVIFISAFYLASFESKRFQMPWIPNSTKITKAFKRKILRLHSSYLRDPIRLFPRSKISIDGGKVSGSLGIWRILLSFSRNSQSLMHLEISGKTCSLLWDAESFSKLTNLPRTPSSDSIWFREITTNKKNEAVKSGNCTQCFETFW